MKPKYCANCKSETMHYKNMCIICGKKSEVSDLFSILGVKNETK